MLKTMKKQGGIPTVRLRMMPLCDVELGSAMLYGRGLICKGGICRLRTLQHAGHLTLPGGVVRTPKVQGPTVASLSRVVRTRDFQRRPRQEKTFFFLEAAHSQRPPNRYRLAGAFPPGPPLGPPAARGAAPWDPLPSNSIRRTARDRRIKLSTTWPRGAKWWNL